MAKQDRTRAALDRLAAAVEDPHAPGARTAIAKALRDRSNLVVAASRSSAARVRSCLAMISI